MATLSIHGHFYQPDRRDPVSGLVAADRSAAPDHDWNARIDRECYRVNAQIGNYPRIGYDFGPTLLLWMRQADPATYAAVIAGGRGGNAIAAGFHHAILPLSLPADRRTEIRWGIADYVLRYGGRPAGFWMPETGVEMNTLADLAAEGIKFVILAPWQAASFIDTRRPYRVDLPGGRRIIAMFYDGELSAKISFEARATENADRFVRDYVGPRSANLPDGTEPLILIASDGELYGHHQPFREKFLAALPDACARAGMRMRPLPPILAALDPGRLPPVTIAPWTSWSCHHGVARWASGCPCCPDGAWKTPLRSALNHLAERVDQASAAALAGLGLDFGRARDGYVVVASGFRPRDQYVSALLGVRADRRHVLRVGELLEAARSRLAMFSSCAWFWDDPSRIETRLVLAYAADAIIRVRAQTGIDLEPGFLTELAGVYSRQLGEDGRRLYARAVDAGLRRAA